MRGKYLLFLSFLFFFSTIYGQKYCFSDNNCHDHYFCSYGVCEIESFENENSLTLNIFKGTRMEYGVLNGYETAQNREDVVLGAIMVISKDDGIYIPEVINIFLEKSDNVEIRNIRLVHDINGNGQYDEPDRIIMLEPRNSYGPFTRFLEFNYGEKVISSEGENNFLFIADIVVDERNNKYWPAYGKIKSIESMIFSENVSSVKYLSFEFPSVGVEPSGRVLFFNSEKARLFVSSESAVVAGITIMVTEDTVLKRLRFSATVRDERSGLFGPVSSEYPDDGVFYVKLEDAKGNARLYSTATIGSLKKIDVEYKLKAYTPVTLYIESDGVICGSDYFVSFKWDSVVLSDPGFQFVDLPYTMESSAYWDESICGRRSSYSGCSILFF